MIPFAKLTRTIAVLALGAALSSCGILPDPDDWFNNKKPLPGERKAVFPEGVPGVPQGVPRELVRGYQAPTEAQPPVTDLPGAERQAEKPAEQPAGQPRPKPRPRTVAVPVRPPATSITVQPGSQTGSAPSASSSGWSKPPPAPTETQQNQPAAQWPAPSSSQSAAPAPSPWPSAPPPGTFSR
jgi:hypothetical protein